MQKITSFKAVVLGTILVFLFTFIFSGTAEAGLNDLKTRLQEKIVNTKDSVAPAFTDSNSLKSGLDGLFSSSGNGGVSNFFTGIIDGFKNLFGGNNSGGGIKGFFSGLINSFKNIFKDISGGTSSGTSDETSTATDSGNTDTATPPPVTTTSGSGGKALLGWLQQAGLTGEKLKMAWSVSMGESGGNPRAFNGNSRTGDKSYGLFQINMIGSMGPARRREFGISSNEELFDPMTNIRAMFKVSSNCTNWRPWSVYKNGSYRKYYNQYPPR